MNSAEFLETFQELIQTDNELSMNTPLADIEEWDSMAIMAAIAYFDVTHGKQLTFEDFAQAKVVGDIAGMIPGFQE